jgi:endonuclease/exonuclease/phosphatase family metal-dependent hydrolase
MKLVTWNIQWACGVDGRVSPERIVEHARRLADFDVLCLQEVAAGFDALAHSRGEDLFAAFAALLPGFTAVDGAVVDLPGEHGRRRFGNLLLTRLPLLRAQRHTLPWPLDTQAKTMPRGAIEATLDTPLGVLRVLTTHLEYHSVTQRAAQVEALRTLHHDAEQRHATQVRDTTLSPYHAVPDAVGTLLCGDFNFRPEDPLHARLQAPFDGDGDGGKGPPAVPRLHDTWDVLHPGQPHAHTVGLYDQAQWPEPFCCDFIYASEPLRPRLKRLVVEPQSQASDHQPLLLELA